MSAISSVSSTNPYQATNLNAFVQFVNDFNALGSALQSGSLSAAQNALTAFQKNLPGGTSSPSSQPFGSNSQANTDYQALANAVQGGDLSGAQQAYANLQGDLDGGQKARRHGHHHANGDAASTQQTSATDDTSDSSSATDTSDVLLDVVA